MIEGWKELKGLIPDDVHDRVSARFNMQLENAIEWRDRLTHISTENQGLKTKKVENILIINIRNRKYFKLIFPILITKYN